MTSLLNKRVQALEGMVETNTPSKAKDLAAVKTRCQMLMEVTDDSERLAALRRTIDEIDQGRYRLDEPFPTDMCYVPR